MPESTCSCWICADKRPRKTEPVDEATLEAVRTIGWHVIGVSESPACPGWAFTVGLWHTRRRPEIAVFGFPDPVGGGLLNELARARVDLPGPRHEETGTLRGNPIQFRKVDRGWHRGLFGHMRWFYRAGKGVPPIRVMQLVWSDKQRRFPWDPDCQEYVSMVQPHAWLPPDEAPPGPYAAMTIRWPYDIERTTRVVVLDTILRGQSRATRVFRDRPGFFVVDETIDRSRPIEGELLREVLLADLYLLDKSVAELFDLPVGWAAARDGGGWRRFRQDAD